MIRMTKDEYYLSIALKISERSTCLRRQYGAVIVNNDEIISTGYNGSPRGEKNCIDINYCERQSLNIPSGERYELCCAVHAEQNAIISASRKEMIGSTLYLAGKNVENNLELTSATPCKICSKFIKNSGIREIVCKKDGRITHINVENL